MINIACAGRLVADPELSQKVNNCCNFRIAAEMNYDAAKHDTNSAFFSVSVFGKRGDTCAAYLHKGDMVFVSGEFYVNEYTSRDGSPRTSLNIRNANVQFLPRGTRAQSSADEDDMLPDE